MCRLTRGCNVATRIRTYQVWCLGLDAGDSERIRSCAGKNHQLVDLDEGALPSSEDIERDEPVLLWMTREAWRRFDNMHADRFLEGMPKILLLPQDCGRKDLELAVSSGFQEIVLGELSEARVHDVLCRSLEVSNVYRDMDRMTHEILLERELLSRKSDVLAFLLEFVRTLSGSSEPSALLEKVRLSLDKLLPIEALHAAFWRQRTDDAFCVDLYMDLPTENGSGEEGLSDAEKAWSALLLRAVSSSLSVCESMLQASVTLHPLTKSPSRVSPDPGRVLVLPLAAGNVSCGILALLISQEYPLSRDEALALDAAMCHLAFVVHGIEKRIPDHPVPFSDLRFSRVAVSQ